MKLKLLFVTHQIPAVTGAGTRMRAGNHIRALSEQFDITLAIIGESISDRDGASNLPLEIARCCVSVIVIDQTSAVARLVQRNANNEFGILLRILWPTPVEFARSGPGLRLLARQLRGDCFDVIYCFRLDMGQVPRLMREHNIRFARSILDLDVFESAMAFSVAKVAGAGRQLAAVRWLDGVKWTVLESLLIPEFNDIHVCSDLERVKLRRRFPGKQWHLIPNVIAGPAQPVASQAQVSFTFLFVGLLSYPPNADAAIFFCKEIIPILRQRAPAGFRIVIVGRDPGAAVSQLAVESEVEVIANPPDLAPYYAQADVAVVPLRAGGGTRIKILEAFSYGLPVIATTIGAEGLDVTPEVDILLADDAKSFAGQCGRLWADEGLRRRIAAAGHDLWRGKYSPEALRKALRRANLTDQLPGTETRGRIGRR